MEMPESRQGGSTPHFGLERGQPPPFPSFWGPPRPLSLHRAMGWASPPKCRLRMSAPSSAERKQLVGHAQHPPDGGERGQRGQAGSESTTGWDARHVEAACGRGGSLQAAEDVLQQDGLDCVPYSAPAWVPSPGPALGLSHTACGCEKGMGWKTSPRTQRFHANHRNYASHLFGRRGGGAGRTRRTAGR